MGIKIGFRVASLDGGTGRGLVPATAMDDEAIMQLDPNAVYTTEFTKMRNYQWHKRYFAMLKVVLDNIDDGVRIEKGIITLETLLLQVKLSLGHCDYVWLDEYQQFCLLPKSISFAAMDENEFREFYKKTLDVCIERYLAKGVENPTSWRDMIDDAVTKLTGFM